MEETKNSIVIDDSDNRLTQKKIVLSHLLEFGCFSMPEANYKYGITRLGAIICTLKKEGWDIETEMVYGNHSKTKGLSKWANYILKATPCV